jgi:hypothetical protein
VEPGAAINVTDEGALYANNGTINLKGEINVKDNGWVSVMGNGGGLNVKSGGTLNVTDNGTVGVKCGGTLNVEGAITLGARVVIEMDDPFNDCHPSNPSKMVIGMSGTIIADSDWVSNFYDKNGDAGVPAQGKTYHWTKGIKSNVDGWKEQ